MDFEPGELFTLNTNTIWLTLLCILGLFLIIIAINKRLNIDDYHEGFSQDAAFSVKTDLAIYDDFYVEIYDKIYLPELQTDYIIERVVKMTDPSERSVFLDIGSGTGHLMNALQKSGFAVYGIDYSPSMINCALSKYPGLSIHQGDVTVPLTYDRGTFSHILCTNMTIYQIRNKREFFQNCYYWMKPNAYLILHLVDKNRFDPIVPGGKPTFLSSPQKYAKDRITDTVIDFIDFQYKSSYHFGDSDIVHFKETMTDGLTNNVRQNEMTLYMEDYNDILHIAMRNGFIVHGQVNMLEPLGDEHQYIFVLERTL
jgi:SAM-dependent methyltransferase